MDTAGFRQELTKIMPGYKWTVHKPLFKDISYLRATGIQTSGFNRLSTLEVTRREKDGKVEYEAKSSGYGKRSPWLATTKASTLAQALRRLQEHYEYVATDYRSHATALQRGRQAA